MKGLRYRKTKKITQSVLECFKNGLAIPPLTIPGHGNRHGQPRGVRALHGGAEAQPGQWWAHRLQAVGRMTMTMASRFAREKSAEPGVEVKPCGGGGGDATSGFYQAKGSVCKANEA